MTTGACNCGAVRYTASGKLRAITFCHCSQCRKLSGHHWAATSVPDDRLTVTDPENVLTWYRSSPHAQRGFCGRCGSALFFRPDGEARMAIGAGTLDAPTGLRGAKHIYVADKGDCYDIADGLPQHAKREETT